MWFVVLESCFYEKIMSYYNFLEVSFRENIYFILFGKVF